LHCRRCQSLRLIPLEKKQQNDNDVFRCQECGYIFSPPNGPAEGPQAGAEKGLEPRTTAVQSGYPARN